MNDSTVTAIDAPDPDDSDEYGFDGDDPLATLHATRLRESPLQANAVLLNRFRLVHRFAGGGQSEVWAAWEIAVRRFVALKFVHARLLEEAQRAANVPGAVTAVYEYNDTAIADNPFVVLEFALGGPVARLAPVWAANSRLLVEKFIPVVRTLAAAHAAGTIHRDLKPNNLLLWAELPPAPRDGSDPPLPDPTAINAAAFVMKVADWGLATGDGDAGSGYGGTLGFAAPEQWAQPATPAADVFGLAATLYFLLTGRCAMTDTRAFAAGLANGTTIYTPPVPIDSLNRRVDPRLSRIIAKSLAAAPGERHASADALARELELWLGGFAVPGDREPTRFRLWAARNRGWLSGAIAAAALIFVLAGVAVSTTVRDAQSRADAADKGRLAAESRRAEEEAKASQATAAAAHLRDVTRLQTRAAARRLAADGNWSEAVPLFDQLLRDGVPDGPDALRLRVDRLHGLLANNDLARFNAELDALAARNDLPALHAAVVRTYRAERLAWDPRTVVLVADVARAAQAQFDAAGTGEEPVAWTATRAHAELLTVAKPLERLAALRRAATDHPFFFLVRRDLLLTLTACGRIDEAAAELNWARLHFPKSPTVGFAASVLEFLRAPGTAPEPGDSLLARGVLVRVRAGLRGVATLPHPFDGGLLAGPDRLKLATDGVGASADALRSAAGEAFPALGLPYSAVDPLVIVFGAFKHFRAALTGKPDELRRADAALAREVEHYPDGTLLVLRAVVRMMLAAATQQRANKSEEIRAFAQPAAWLDDGCRTATVLPSPGLLYFFHVLGATAAIMPARFDPADPAGYVARLESLLVRMRHIGRLVPAHRKLHADVFFQAYTMKVEQIFEAEVWELNKPQGAERLAERKRRLVHALMGSFHDWIDHDPKAPEPWFELARLGEWAGYPKAWVAQQLEAVEARNPNFFGLRAAKARVKAAEVVPAAPDPK